MSWLCQNGCRCFCEHIMSDYANATYIPIPFAEGQTIQNAVNFAIATTIKAHKLAHVAKRQSPTNADIAKAADDVRASYYPQYSE